MNPSAAALNILKNIETLQLKPMLPTPNDKPTIGYGCTAYENGTPVKLTDPAITKERAESLLKHKAQQYINCVNKVIVKPMTQQQFDAFFIMCFNCGAGAFSKPARVAYFFNIGNIELVREWWIKSFITQGGRVLQGLINRRKKEWLIFNDGIY